MNSRATKFRRLKIHFPEMKNNDENILKNHRAESKDFQNQIQREGGGGGAGVVGGAVEVVVVKLTVVRPVVMATTTCSAGSRGDSGITNAAGVVQCG